MKRIVFATVIALMATGLASNSLAQSITLTVDCAKGQKISDALARGDASKPLTILVRGTCNESFTVARDDVTLRGDASTGATVHGPDSTVDTIIVLADRITVDRLTVTGGRSAIQISASSNTVVTDSHIEDTTSDGIRIYVGYADIINTTVQRAGGNGISLGRGAVLRLRTSEIRNCALTGIVGTSMTQMRVADSTIAGNGSGVGLSHVSSGVITGSHITGNGKTSSDGFGLVVADSAVQVYDQTEISDNANAGVLLRAGKINLQNSTIAGNGSDGINAYMASVVDIFMTDVSNNSGNGIQCMLNCTAAIAGATIHGNSNSGISLVFASKLHLHTMTTDATGNGGAGGLYCSDQESSAVDLGLLTGGYSESCTAY